MTAKVQKHKLQLKNGATIQNMITFNHHYLLFNSFNSYNKP
jgi:hypothetical protein